MSVWMMDVVLPVLLRLRCRGGAAVATNPDGIAETAVTAFGR